MIKKNPIFNYERDMHQWLVEEFENIDGLGEIIIENNMHENNVENLNFINRKIIVNQQNCISALNHNYLISDDTNISIQERMILRPDLFLISRDPDGIVLVELKNRAASTRESGTELSAYTNSIVNIYPYMPNANIYYVIISSEWPSLLKNYVRNEVIWQNKNILCLKPKRVESSTKLDIVNIHDKFSNYPQRLSPKNLRGIQLCVNNYEKTEIRENILYTALEFMSDAGYRQNDNGFCLLWRDLSDSSITSHIFTIVSVCPFSFLERFKHEPAISDTIDSLKKHHDLEKQPSVEASQSFTNIVQEAQNFLDNYYNITSENPNDFEFFESRNNGRAENIAFKGWGLFGELYKELLCFQSTLDDTDGEFVSNYSKSIGFEVINEIIDFEQLKQ